MNRLIAFYDKNFPQADGQAVDEGQLGRVSRVVGASGLSEALREAAIAAGDGRAESETACFVNLHAPYFPKDAWPELLAFLGRGGGLVSIGGAPFKIPVRMENGRWHAEAEQTAYHRQLRIHETLRVSTEGVVRLKASSDLPMLAGREELFDVAPTWNLVPHATKASDLPHEMGSAGPMDAWLHAVLRGVTADGREIAAPVVVWDNAGGDFAGGRWLFVNGPIGVRFWERGGAEALAEWAAACGRGMTDIWLKPGYASYEPGERAMLTLQTQALGAGAAGEWTFRLSAKREDETTPCWTAELEIRVGRELDNLRLPIPVVVREGYYEVECRAESKAGEIRLLRQGFWGFDGKLLAEGEPIKAGRDYFERDGRPMPVVGMTYMSSDVARKFLFLPNAAVWRRDMAQMKNAGINWIRTGIWTAYRNVMQSDGHASEEALRSIDAFLLTAKKIGLQVTFTFFSFTPETWEGEHPYLDPRSVEAQKRFVRSIASRYPKATNVDWDLINEPSFTDPARIFSVGPRPSGKRFERKAFSSWLERRHGSVATLQDRWNMTPSELPDFGSAVPPEASEINFDIMDMRDGKRGTRWLDYCLFSMDMFNRWASELSAAIKSACPGHLVAVGQDEGLKDQRPTPLFYEEASDYTTVHSWWQNDNLVWDGIFTKSPDKPNLVQETGIMYVETAEGRAKRSEEELYRLLERKYAYAFATGGAGAVQWIWNTNAYMDNANESHIGALRADGTEKPEALVSYDFGRFIGEIRDLFAERRLEDVAVVFPYANDFSNRRFAYEATTKLTRALSYGLKTPFRAVSPYKLGVLKRNPAKLIALPSPYNVEEETLRELLAIAETTGATLLVTGPLGIDEYWRWTDRFKELAGSRRLVNASREERLVIGETPFPVSFGDSKIAEIAKETPTGGSASPSRVVEIPLGAGRLVWCPLPVELNERSETMLALYRHALALSGFRAEMTWAKGGDEPGVYGRKLAFGEGALYVFVSEQAEAADIEIEDPVTGRRYAFSLPEERSVLFATNAAGEVIAVYRPDETTINF
ncbi:beta-galactosidase [Cohnella suwonensis]|uniref:Beta-galactosidase n=1 Tax=Cohnella suwonensis TaxID=696072 RepID=A0ABW0LZZ5_9BACL